MDYDLEIMVIPLVAHQVIAGGGGSSLTQYATDQFNRFDHHIRNAAADAGLTFNARQRTIIAALATLETGGTARDCAENAIAAYVSLFGS